MRASKWILIAACTLPLHLACAPESEEFGDLEQAQEEGAGGEAALEDPSNAPIAESSSGNTFGATETDPGGTTAPTPPPAAPADWRGAVPPHEALLKAGLHPDASDWLRTIGVSGSQLSQTLGSAAASAGTHEKDGVAGGLAYAAAADFSVRNANGTLKTETEIRALLASLTSIGYAGWYRKPGYDGWPSSEAPHIHAVYVGCAMKLSVRNQMRDFFVGKNGLASHSTYSFYKWTPAQIANIKSLYAKYNSLTN